MTVAEVVKIAESQVGYREKKSNTNLDSFTANAGANNFTKYARDTKGYWGNKQGLEWCTTFVLWVFWEACGRSFDAVKKVQPYSPYGASCKWQTSAYKSAKRWSDKPEVGYQAFFTRGHTGIVVGVSGNKITLVEGNSNNRVEKRTYSFPNAIFTGFGVPNYAAEKKEEPKKEDPKPATSAFTPYNAKVTPSNGLNVRTGAGTSYKKLGALSEGTTVKVLEEKDGWGRIVYKDKAGWICLAYTKKVA